MVNSAGTGVFNSDPSDVELVDIDSEDGDRNEGNKENEDNDASVSIGCGLCSKVGSLWYVKVIVNVILPICWIALGAYCAVDYFTLYYTNADDEKYGDLNSADKQIVHFCVTIIVIVGLGLLISLFFHLIKFDSWRIYFEIASSTAIIVYGIVVYYTNANNTSDEFFYSYINGWTIATVTLAGFVLLYHAIVHLDCTSLCCCRGRICCDCDKGYAHGAESELDRMEEAGVPSDAAPSRGEEKMDDLCDEKTQRRAEKKARRKARESKRKERYKRKVERLHKEKEEWIALQGRPYLCW